MSKLAKRVKEYRAKLKSLTEQRADLQAELQGILDCAKAETRAFTEEEQEKFDEVEGKIKQIDATIEREERARNIGNNVTTKTKQETQEQAEIRAFANFIREKAGLPVEQRANEQNFNIGNNGAVIPTTIANMVIKEVEDRCPILAGSMKFNVKGSLQIPTYGKAKVNDTEHDITVGYQTEFNELTADAGKFSSINLSGYLAGALTLVGKSLINNSDISIVNFVVSEMADKISSFLENELLNGTGSTNNHATGILTACTNTLTAASATSITADELIDLQSKVKQAYQTNAVWTMNPDTFSKIKKLKDSNNRYLLQDDITGEFPYRLLGKPVYVSDNMPKIGTGAKTVMYGDYSALATNFRENIEIQVLLEKFATQHAIGIVAWMEFDSNVVNNQKMAVLVQA